MAIDFPNSPTVGQTATYNGITRQWDGTTWNLIPVTIQGVTGATGTQGIQGNAGYIGSDGVQGIQGIQGIQGKTPIVSQTSAPADTEVLWIDTDDIGPTIPSGGTTGQVLVKSSNTNYAVEWSDAIAIMNIMEAY